MLFALMVWGYVTVLCLLYGFGLLTGLSHLLKLQKGAELSFVSICLLGLAGITSLAGIFSLFTRLGWEVNIILSCGALAILFWQRQILLAKARQLFQVSWKEWPLGLILTLLAALAVIWIRSIGEPLNYDTGLYHAQAIRWMETGPLPIGLGNLHDRLAFNSMWLVGAALFSFSFLGIGSFHLLNGWLSALIVIELLSRARRLFTAKPLISDWLSLVLVFALRLLLSLEFSSPGTDLPAALLTWMVVILFFERIERNTWREWDAQGAAILILSLYAVTVKLNTLPLLLLPLIWFVQHGRYKSCLPAGAAAGLAVLGPWVGRNILLSGYLIYPFSGLDILSVPWKIPLDKLVDAENWIRSWARLPGRHQSEVLAMSLRQWLPLWYESITSKDRILLLLIAAGLVCLSAAALWNRVRKRPVPDPGWFILFGVISAGCLFWFWQAPTMRFGYGFLVLMVGIGFVPLGRLAIKPGRMAHRLAAIMVTALLAYQGIGLVSSVRETTFPARLFFPLTYPSVDIHLEPGADFDIYVPDSGDQCWYAPLPCTPRVEENLHLRGGNLEGGFLP